MEEHPLSGPLFPLQQHKTAVVLPPETGLSCLLSPRISIFTQGKFLSLIQKASEPFNPNFGLHSVLIKIYFYALQQISVYRWDFQITLFYQQLFSLKKLPESLFVWLNLFPPQLSF